MDWFYQNQGGFLNSTLFLSLVTLFLGWSAYSIYSKGKLDKKREAATVIYSELSLVVQALPAIKADFNRIESLVEGRYLLKKSSWNKYRYILLPTLSIDQWSALRGFFASVTQYDDAVRINDGYFDNNAEQIWISLHKHYLKVLEDEPIPGTLNIPASLTPSTSEKIKYFTDLYIRNVVDHAGYSPLRPINMARQALDNIDENILVSSVGTKLDEIARHKSFGEHIMFWRR